MSVDFLILEFYDSTKYMIPFKSNVSNFYKNSRLDSLVRTHVLLLSTIILYFKFCSVIGNILNKNIAYV